MQHLIAAALASVALSGCAGMGWGHGHHGMHGGGMHGMHGGMHGTAEPVCGDAMMSAQERDEHLRRMRDATSAVERERIREQHRDAMAARARERGLPWREGPGCRVPGAG